MKKKKNELYVFKQFQLLSLGKKQILKQLSKFYPWVSMFRLWSYVVFALAEATIDIESLQNRLLKFCYVPTTSAGLNRLLFLLQTLTVLMKQTRQAVRVHKQSIILRCLWWQHFDHNGYG
jgi:hypothetical protein